jgi:hypothetical protein
MFGERPDNMSARNWNRTATAAEAYRRAGGRRHYNGVRKARAWWRRRQIVDWLARNLFLRKRQRGFQTELACIFQVSKATISRDIKFIIAALRKQWQDSRLAEVVAQAKREGMLGWFTDV